MLWDSDTPDDDTYEAKYIHLQMHSDKQMIRERLEAWNGTFNEHGDFEIDDADDGAVAGIHPISEVGFARVSTAADRLTSPKPHTLHYFTTGDATYDAGLYTVDADNNYVKLTTLSHSDIYCDEESDPHIIYIFKDDDVTMGGDLIATTISLSGSQPDTEDDEPLLAAHIYLGWVDAHFEGCVENTHFADDSISNQDLDIVEPIGTTEGTAFSPSDADQQVFLCPMMDDTVLYTNFSFHYNQSFAVWLNSSNCIFYAIDNTGL